mgnify:CR=1 FL=1|tara:strand:+ start:3512 stop:4339 length:828 start_codon:yes stop_codon:yes gene_type:complete
MFIQYDESNLENLISKFCSSFAIKKNLPQTLTYEAALRHISSFIVLPDWNKTTFITKSQSIKIIPSYILHRDAFLSKKDDLSTQLINSKRLDDYYLMLEKSHPKAVYFCNKILKVILIAGLDSYIEGTTSDGLGIAHIDFKSHYNQQDFNELIIHQITHTLLFIDDYVALQVEGPKKELSIKTTAKNKRGGNSFPLYVLFHSFCVGVEILNYRLKSEMLDAPVNYHPVTSIALNRCKQGFAILHNNINLFTPNGRKLLRDYGNHLDELLVWMKYA